MDNLSATPTFKYNVNRYVSMKKNFWQWAIGDAFTKIACGIFGGSVVAFYYNAFVLTPEKTNDLFSLYWILAIFGVLISIIGYFMIQKAGAN